MLGAEFDRLGRRGADSSRVIATRSYAARRRTHNTRAILAKITAANVATIAQTKTPRPGRPGATVLSLMPYHPTGMRAVSNRYVLDHATFTNSNDPHAR